MISTVLQIEYVTLDFTNQIEFYICLLISFIIYINFYEEIFDILRLIILMFSFGYSVERKSKGVSE